MKHQFLPVFRHEFKTTAASKPFIITTILFALIILLGVGHPFLLGRTDKPKASAGLDMDEIIINSVGIDFSTKKLLVNTDAVEGLDAQAIADYMKTDALGFAQAEAFAGSAEEMEQLVSEEEADYGLYFSSPLEYTLYTRQLGMTDVSPYTINDALTTKLRIEALEKLGASAQEANEILNAQTIQVLVATQNDGVTSQGYTYVLMMLLYMTILVYGSIVASSVAAEKSSRAMELLITAARPGSLMFGKVLGVGFAGMCQMVFWILCGYVSYKLSGEYWSETPMVSSLFNGGNTRLFIYTVVFFVLGYLLYSFLFGAMGSLVSRTEDLQATLMPITLLVVLAFMVSYFSTLFNYVDSVLMKVLSFLPFTSPLSMFIRIINNNAESWEIALSIAALLAGISLTGALATAIYRVGVLLYGKPPRINELVKLIKKQ